MASKPALFSAFTFSICARRVRTSSCQDLVETDSSASLCLQATLQTRAAVSAAKVPNARRNRITELLNLTLCSTTKSTSDTPPGPRPFQTENYPPFELDCTRLQSDAAPSVRVLTPQPPKFRVHFCTSGAFSDFRYSMMAQRSSGESAGPITPFPRGPSLNSWP